MATVWATVANSSAARRMNLIVGSIEKSCHCVCRALSWFTDHADLMHGKPTMGANRQAVGIYTVLTSSSRSDEAQCNARKCFHCCEERGLIFRLARAAGRIPAQ